MRAAGSSSSRIFLAKAILRSRAALFLSSSDAAGPAFGCDFSREEGGREGEGSEEGFFCFLKGHESVPAKWPSRPQSEQVFPLAGQTSRWAGDHGLPHARHFVDVEGGGEEEAATKE